MLPTEFPRSLPAAFAHVRVAEVDALREPAGPGQHAWLCAADRERLAAIRAPRRAAQFVAARRLARIALRDACGSRARDWQVRTDAHGIPRIAEEPGVFVSLAHSGDLVACAVGSAPLGVDLEVPRAGRDWAGLLAAIATPPEREALRDGMAEASALALWTLKEAWLKAAGGELFATMLGHAAQVCPAAPANANGRTWTTVGAAAALVVPGGMPALSGDIPPAPAGSFWRVAPSVAGS